MTTFNLEATLNEYAAMKAELQPMLDQLQSLEFAIRQHVVETGEVAETELAKVTIRHGYERASWDSKKLDGYAAAHPEILAFRTVTEVGPSAVIKVK